jgi:hypothetical protein
MPDELDRCVDSVKADGKSESSAYAICSKSTGWKVGKGGTKDKKKWVKRKKANLYNPLSFTTAATVIRGSRNLGPTPPGQAPPVGEEKRVDKAKTSETESDASEVKPDEMSYDSTKNANLLGRIGALLGATTLPGEASKAYVSQLDTDADTLKEKMDNRRLRLKALMEGHQPTTPRSGSPLDSFVTGELSDAAKRRLEEKSVREKIILDRILNTTSTADPAIVAHELGHVEQSDLMKSFPLYGLGKLTPGMAAVYLALTRKLSPSKVKWSLGLGMGPSAGTIINELDASRRGYGHMRDMDYDRMESLKSFMGVPTYAAAASSPLLALLLRKKIFKV